MIIFDHTEGAGGQVNDHGIMLMDKYWRARGVYTIPWYSIHQRTLGVSGFWYAGQGCQLWKYKPYFL